MGLIPYIFGFLVIITSSLVECSLTTGSDLHTYWILEVFIAFFIIMLLKVCILLDTRNYTSSYLQLTLTAFELMYIIVSALF